MAAWTGAQVKVPVKFIIGDLDVTYHIPGAKEFIHGDGFKKFVPFLQELVVMEGVAHFINQEKAEETAAHIYDFFKKFWSTSTETPTDHFIFLPQNWQFQHGIVSV